MGPASRGPRQCFGEQVMNGVLFILVVIISFTVVRIGAIAFQLTGLSWSQAKFQALSCFTGTGFTTRESELIVGNSQRRRIASVMMVLGNAGLILLIATFANSLQPDVYLEHLTAPVMPDWIPYTFVPLANFLILLFAFLFVVRVFGRMHVSDRITSSLRRTLLRRRLLDSLSLEEPVLSSPHCAVLKIVVGERSHMIGTSLSQIAAHDVEILALETGGKITTNPPGEMKLSLGDSLVCFGQAAQIRETLLQTR
jgi:hypothetical protein